MKKITLLFTLLFAITFGFSQTTELLNESFDSALPGELSNNTDPTFISETSLSWNASGNPGGSMSASGVVDENNGNSVGRAFQFLYVNGGFDYGSSASVSISFDIKIDADLVGTNLQFQTQVPKVGGGVAVVNNENIQNSVTTGGGWTNLTFNMTPNPSEFDTNGNLLIFFWNMAAGPVNGFGGAFEIDNIVITGTDAGDPPSGPSTVTVDVASSWTGYMNVFDNPADPTPDCAGTGGFCFGSAWGIGDLKTVIGASDITLQPNFNLYNASDPYWADGATGNKICEASTFVEPGSAFNGNDLTFTGEVTSNTLDAGYTAEFFIKALDPNNGFSDALSGSKTVALPASGVFSVTATGAELTAGLIIQYGFRILGLNANPVDEGALGSIVVAPVSLSNSDLEQLSFNVYPNPSNDVWNVKTNNTVINTVQVFDVLGKQVMTLTPESTEVKIDASTLNTGLYIAKIATPNGVSNIRLIKN